MDILSMEDPAETARCAGTAAYDDRPTLGQYPRVNSSDSASFLRGSLSRPCIMSWQRYDTRSTRAVASPDRGQPAMLHLLLEILSNQFDHSQAIRVRPGIRTWHIMLVSRDLGLPTDAKQAA
jgi:hypothetical protein